MTAPKRDEAAEAAVLRFRGDHMRPSEESTVGDLVGQLFHANDGGDTIAAQALACLGEELYIVAAWIEAGEVAYADMARAVTRLAVRASAAVELDRRSRSVASAPESGGRVAGSSSE